MWTLPPSWAVDGHTCEHITHHSVSCQRVERGVVVSHAAISALMEAVCILLSLVCTGLLCFDFRFVRVFCFVDVPLFSLLEEGPGQRAAIRHRHCILARLARARGQTTLRINPGGV